MSKYWQKRFELLEDARNKTAKETVRSITPAFDQAQAQIEKEINAWYGRFAKNNEINLIEAKKLLNTRELMPSNHVILCCPFLFLPSIFPSIRFFSNESALHIRWPKVLQLQLQY